MGKSTGFLEYERVENAGQEPLERIKTYREFHTPLNPEERQKQGARCMDCGVPFCQNGKPIMGMVSGCPLNNLCPEWNELVYKGRMEDAARRLLLTNCFPEFTSRVCPALCEAACTCNLDSEPVSTKENERAYCKAKEYAESIKNGEKKSLIITGNIGTGKTHLASSIANFLIESEISVVFGTLINLLNEVKDTYTMENKTESFIIEKYSKVPLLIIDDLGKERPSEWTLEKLFTIINNRYENNLPVVITTNYNRERLRERLANNVNYEIADSIISRLYEMCKGISLNGKDKRKELV